MSCLVKGGGDRSVSSAAGEGRSTTSAATLAPHEISQGLRRLVVASSPPAARDQGETWRVTGHRPGVDLDLA